MSFRPTPEIRKRLELAADHSKRSLSQEIEFRLELSFRVDDWLEFTEIHGDQTQ